MVYAIPNIGEAIRTARLAAGLTQSDLAKRAAVSQAQISLAESGSDIRMSTLQMIAGALDLVPMLVPRKIQSVVRGVIATQTK
jgi:predicted transcriptional regulator